MWAILSAVCLAGLVNTFQATFDTWTADVLRSCLLYTSTFLYRLDSSILPPDRAYQTVTDWGGTDQLNTEYDQYLGNWAVYASRDLYRDGQMLAAKGEKIAGSGFDSSKFGGNLFTVDADENGKVTADATQTYLDLVSADNEHEAGWVLYLSLIHI